jgi:hypothetical protein
MATVAFWYQVGQPKRFTTLPPLEERIFPDLDVVVQGKDMISTARTFGGKVEQQVGYDWTGDGQILFFPSSENPVLELDFHVEKEELRGLVLRLTKAPDYGIYRVFLDGKDVTELEDYPDWNTKGAMDFYDAGIIVRDYYLGSYMLSQGKHTLRFECAGMNPFSKGKLLGLDSIRLRERWQKKRKSLRPAKKY